MKGSTFRLCLVGLVLLAGSCTEGQTSKPHTLSPSPDFPSIVDNEDKDPTNTGGASTGSGGTSGDGDGDATGGTQNGSGGTPQASGGSSLGGMGGLGGFGGFGGAVDP